MTSPTSPNQPARRSMAWTELGTSALLGAAAIAFVEVARTGLVGEFTRGLTLGAKMLVAAGVLAATHLVARSSRKLRAVALGTAMTLLIMALRVVALLWHESASWGQIAYVAVAATVLFAGGEILARRAPANERLRLLVVGAVAFAAVRFYLTPTFIGYLDARWYAYMFRDFLEQWRNGHFPVFVGQTEFALNGAVHPIRSAPLHMYLGGILDTLSFHRLTPLALEHATIVVSGLMGAFAMYWSLLTLAPLARWRASLLAALYILCPALLSPLYAGDMFMLFMALPALPLVVVGNAHREASPVVGHTLLAAGLGYAWYCHPPTAMWCTLLTAIVQAGRLGPEGPGFRYWRSLLLSGFLFAGLSAYYFATMVEIPYREPLSPAVDFVQLGAMIAAVVGLARFLARYEFRWLVLTAAGLLALWWVAPGWFLWAGGTSTLVLVIAVTLHRRRTIQADVRWEILAVGLVVAACAVALTTKFVGDFNLMRGLAVNRSRLGLMLRPIPLLSSRPWPSVQLGWTLLASVVAWVVLAVARKRTDLRWLVLPIAVVAVPQFPLPRIAEFFVTAFPQVLARIVGLTLTVREMPVLAPLAVVGTFLAVAHTRSRRTTVIGVALLGIGLCWSLYQLRAFYYRGYQALGSTAFTARMFAPENVVTYHYDYDLLPIPPRFREGVNDWRFETRLVDEHGAVLVGPAEIAQAMPYSGAGTVSLHEAKASTAANRFPLTPAIDVPPHTTRLLQLDFGPAPPRGRLVLTGGDHLESDTLTGAGWHAVIGEQARVPTVIPLVNSSARAARITLTYLGTDDSSARTDKPFAEATILPFVPNQSPIRVDSLLPYRATVRAPVPCLLESPRVYLPGYRARVDGQPAAILASSEHLVAVAVPSGEHVVEIEYAGTPRVWLAFWLTLTAWLALVGFALRHIFAQTLHGDDHATSHLAT